MMTNDQRGRMTGTVFAVSVVLVASMSGPAASQDSPKPSTGAWLRCLQGNSFSEVEKTPEHAVEIAFENCRAQEDQAIREQFPADASSNMEMIRSRVREGVKPALVSRVVEDRASDPELHAPFATAVKEDERLRAKARASAPMNATATGAPVTATANCVAFQSRALAKPNQLTAFVKASSNPTLATTLAGSLGPFKIDFPKDEFTSTNAYNTQRQMKWLTALSGGQNLVVRKVLSPYDLTYDADRGVMVIEIGNAIYNSLRRDAEGAYFQIDYKTIREKTQFRGGTFQSVELELPTSAIGTQTQTGSRVIEFSMSPEAARGLKNSAVIAFEVSLPIATDPSAVVMYHDLVKFGEKFPDDPRGSIHSRRSFPVRVTCGALFAGTQFVGPIPGNR